MMFAFGFTFLAILSLSQAISVRPEHSLKGPYLAGGENLLNWDLTGSAQLGDGYIRLTTDEEEKEGAIWNNFPCYSNNWEYQVQFHIHGKGVHLSGDGMALWYVREEDMLHSGPVFGSKDFFSGLGVFIDTFRNQAESNKPRHPYISAMVNNGSLHYENDEDGTVTQIGGCHAPVRNLEFLTRIAVSYTNNLLALYIDIHGTGQWTLCFKSEEVYLPTGYFFGISASTSDVSDNHDVIAVTTLNLDLEDQEFIDNTGIIPEAKNIHILPKYHKKFIEEEMQKVEQETEINEDEESETIAETDTEEVTLPPTSLLRKLIYITGTVIILLISISVFRKYSERRRERMEKRLY